MNGKTILVTGGTGSFGKKFIEFLLLKYKKIKKCIVYSRDELKQYEMSKVFSETKYPCMRYFLGDVRDRERLTRALYKVDYVIHAAALKQVPFAEYNPIEFIKTNVIGAQNVIESSIDAKVKKVIALSTDKATAPINLYGATKLCSDKLFIAANEYAGANIKFSIVKYGNVMGSRGSVVPYFKKIANSGFFPITHKDMTRFNISLDDGIKIVDWALENALGGEVIVPKIPSYRLTDVAKSINPNCKLKFVGLRKGEKIHEEMVTASDSFTTYDIGKFYLILKDNEKDTLKLFKNKFKKIQKVKEGFSYSSNTNKFFLDIKDLKKMIKKI
ncbi:MAG: UDP-N-acetylglucosamine 4,6-dehydratase (inverting) [Pelagibacteraceae bacterium]